MNTQELKTILKNALFDENGKMFEPLIEFKEKGGQQKDAYKVLKEIRREMEASNVEEKYDDILLEVMDVVWGWCNPSSKIWDTTLTDEDVKE